MLVICRFIAGIGIGGELPLADAYLADLLPARWRGAATAWAYTVGFCGVPVAGFLARGLAGSAPLGLAGWRWLFVIGGVGAIIVWLLRAGLPESPRWLVAVGRSDEAERIVRRFEEQAGGDLPEPEVRVVPEGQVSVRTLLLPPWRRRTVMLYVFQVLQAFGYYGFGTLVPIVLVSKGFSVTGSLTYFALTTLGYPIGSALSIPIIERMQRKWLIVASAIGMAVFGLLFGFASAPTAHRRVRVLLHRDQQPVLQRLPHLPGRTVPDPGARDRRGLGVLTVPIGHCRHALPPVGRADRVARWRHVRGRRGGDAAAGRRRRVARTEDHPPPT